MAEILRREVLQQFKKLHRTRLNTFKGDEHALKVLRAKINEEYRKNRDVENQTAIEKLHKFAQEVEHEVRTNVVQAVEKKPGTFELRIRPEVLSDNAKCESWPTSRGKRNGTTEWESPCGKDNKKS